MEYLWGYGGNLWTNKRNVLWTMAAPGVDGMQKILDFVYKDKILPEPPEFKLSADVMIHLPGGKGR